jgi:hypothetical protein
MGVAPAFGASEIESAPFGPMVAEVFPAGIDVPDAVVNADQLTSTVPLAGAPLAL